MQRNNKSQLRRLAVILEDSNDAITVQSLDGNILAWNKGAKRMYGYDENEALKMNISAIVPEDKQVEALQYLEDIKKGKTVESFETTRVKKDGTVIYVWLVLTCLTNDNGQVDSVASTERDITETKRKIRQLRELLPICAGCKSIRIKTGDWQEIESYVEQNYEAVFSHGICPICLDRIYGDEEWYKRKKAANLNGQPS